MAELQPRGPMRRAAPLFHRRSHGSLATFGIITLFVAAVGGWFMFTSERRTHKPDAALDAARDVGNVADKAGKKLEEATRRFGQ